MLAAFFICLALLLPFYLWPPSAPARLSYLGWLGACKRWFIIAILPCGVRINLKYVQTSGIGGITLRGTKIAVFPVNGSYLSRNRKSGQGRDPQLCASLRRNLRPDFTFICWAHGRLILYSCAEVAGVCLCQPARASQPASPNQTIILAVKYSTEIVSTATLCDDYVYEYHSIVFGRQALAPLSLSSPTGWMLLVYLYLLPPNFTILLQVTVCHCTQEEMLVEFCVKCFLVVCLLLQLSWWSGSLHSASWPRWPVCSMWLSERLRIVFSNSIDCGQ